MSRFWSDRTRELTPYVPGEQRSGGSIIKLNTNENPYPPSPSVMAAIAAVTGDALRRYPDPLGRELCEALAARHGRDPDEVFVGNGSDEVLALAFQAFFMGRGVQYPDITYSFYPVYCRLYAIVAKEVPLDDDFCLASDAFAVDGSGIVFPNPNAPTGLALTRDELRELLERHPDQPVLIDEAYAGFGAESAVPLVSDHPNLLVVQTFSKNRSLAGLRLGCAFGQPEIIEGLRRVKDSFNSYPVDALATAAGIASVADEDSHRESLERVVATRARLTDALAARGYTVLPSAANFLFVRPPGGDAARIHGALAERDVLIRYWDRPRLSEWLRISIGTDAETDALLHVLDDLTE